MPLQAGQAFIELTPRLSPAFAATTSAAVTAATGPAIAAASAAFTNLGGKLRGIGSNLSKAITLPIIGIGAAAVASALSVDKAFDTIRVGTGATGTTLAQLRKDFGAVGTNVTAPLERVGEVIGDLNTRLGLTGEPMQRLAKQLLDLEQISGGTEISLDAVTRVLGAFRIPTEDSSDAMDRLFRASQATGVGFNDLAVAIVSQSAAFSELGFNMDETAAIIGDFEAAGVNTSSVLGALRLNIAAAAKEGKSAGEFFRESVKTIEGFIKSGNDAAAQAKAKEVFGARTFLDALDAIRRGKFDISATLAKITEGTDTISGLAKETESFPQKFERFKNKTKLALAPLGDVIFPALEKAIDAIVPVVTRIGAAFKNLSPGVKTAIVVFAGVLAALGPVVWIFGVVATAIGAILSPVGLVILGIAALGAAAIIAYKKFEPFRDIVDAIARFFTERLVPAVKAIVSAFKEGGLSAALDELIARFPIFRGVATVVGTVADAVRTGIEGIVVAFGYLRDEVFPIVADVVTGIIKPFANFGTRIADRLSGIVEAFRNIFLIVAGIVAVGIKVILFLWRAVGDDILRVVKAAFDAVKTVIKAALDIIIGIVDVFIGIFTLDFGRIWSGLSGIVSGAFDAIAAVVTLGFELIASIFGGALSLLGEGLTLAWDTMVGVVGGALDDIVGFVVGLGGRIIAPFVAVWSAILGGARTAIDGVVGFIFGLPGRITALAGAVLAAAVGIGKAIIDGVGAGLSAVGNFVGDLAGAVGEAFKKAANWVIKKINEAIPDSVKWGPFSINLPDNPIPTFGGGGVVPGPPGAAGLAELHGQETVFTPDQLKALGRVISGGGARGGPTITYVANYTFDGTPTPRTLRDVDAATLRGLQAALRTV